MDSDTLSHPISSTVSTSTKNNPTPSPPSSLKIRPSSALLPNRRPVSAVVKNRNSPYEYYDRNGGVKREEKERERENSNYLPKNQFYLYNKPDLYKLQTDLVELKKLYNKSEDEKSALKYNILKVENNNKKLEKYIDELLLKSNDISNYSNDGSCSNNKFMTLKNDKNLIELLKNKIINLEFFNTEKENELSNLKLSLKSNKLNETNNIINILNNDIKRLEEDKKLLILKHEKELNIPTLNISHWKDIYKKLSDLKEENSYLSKQLEEVVNHAKINKDNKLEANEKKLNNISNDNKNEELTKLSKDLESTKKLLDSKTVEISTLKSDFEAQISKLNVSIKTQSDENFVNKEKINGLKKIIKDHDEKNISAAQNSFKASYEEENNMQTEYSSKITAIENENKKKIADICFDVEKKLTLQLDDKQKSLNADFNKKLLEKESFHIKIEEKLQFDIDALNKTLNASNYKVEQLMIQISILNSEKSEENKKLVELRKFCDSQVEKLKNLEAQMSTVEDDNLFFKTEANIVKDENNRLKEELKSLKSKPILVPSIPAESTAKHSFKVETVTKSENIVKSEPIGSKVKVVINSEPKNDIIDAVKNNIDPAHSSTKIPTIQVESDPKPIDNDALKDIKDKDTSSVKKSVRPTSAMKRANETDSRKSFDKGNSGGLVAAEKSNYHNELKLFDVLKPDQASIDPMLLESARQFLNKGNNVASKELNEPSSPVLQHRTFSLAQEKSRQDVVVSVESMISEVLQNKIVNTNDRTASVSYFNTVSSLNAVKPDINSKALSNVSLQSSQSNKSLSSTISMSNSHVSVPPVVSPVNKQVTFAVTENVSK